MPHISERGIHTSDLNRRRKFILNTAYIAIIIALVFLVFRYLLNLIWPFFLAFLFAWILTPAIRWLTAKCHLKYNLSVALCLIVFFAILGGLVIICSARIVSWVSDFIVWLPTVYTAHIEPALTNSSEWLEELANRISPEAYTIVTEAVPTVISSISSAATNLSVKLVSIASGWATKLPKRLLSTIICVIATIFTTADFSHITSFIIRQVPEKPRHVVLEAKKTFVEVIFKYGKSYGIIMLITFAEILLGLLILRQKSAVLIAILIAVFDIFPIVGAGMILFPWSVITILNGAVAKGIGLLTLWIIVIVVRQIMEPRVVGYQVGLHPLLTLIAMFVGSKLFGGLGLLGLPVSCAIIKSLDDTGVIHLIKKETSGKTQPPPAEAEVPPEKK